VGTQTQCCPEINKNNLCALFEIAVFKKGTVFSKVKIVSFQGVNLWVVMILQIGAFFHFPQNSKKGRCPKEETT